MGYYGNSGFAGRAFSSASRAGGSILNTLVSRKTIPLFFIIMLISILGSVHESVKQRSFVPVIVDVGGRLLDRKSVV